MSILRSGVAASEESTRSEAHPRRKKNGSSLRLRPWCNGAYTCIGDHKIYATRQRRGIDRRDCRVGQLRRTAEVAKLNAITMKAGEFKDTGAHARMTPRARIHAGLIDNMHTQFIQRGDGRHAKEADIRAIANGKVWSGEQALALKWWIRSRFRRRGQGYGPSREYLREPTLVYPPKEKRSASICCSAMFPIICLRGRIDGAGSRFTIFGSSGPVDLHRTLKFERL